MADLSAPVRTIRAAIQIPIQGTEVVIPPTRSRKTPLHDNRTTYKAHNLVERLWCRLKDWRRVATRYDKLARNYTAGVLLAVTLTYWC